MIPTFILEHVHKAGLVPFESDAQEEGNIYFMPSDAKQAALSGDSSKFESHKKAHYDDMKAVYDHIQNYVPSSKKDTPFIEMEPDEHSGGLSWYLIASDNGWMWSYPAKSAASNTDPNIRPTVSVGSFSKNANVVGLSTVTLDKDSVKYSEMTVMLAATTIIGTFVKRWLNGASYDVASAAADAAVTEVAEDIGIVVGQWTARAAGFILGTVGGFAVGLAVAYLIDVFYRKYGLQINIYNWSTQEDWDIVEWHGDNANMSGPFKEGHLVHMTKQIPTPHGFDPAKEPVATYATYTVENESKTAEGVGIGLKVVSKSDSSRVIYIKYVVRWGGDNKIGLATGSDYSSLGSFYDGSWASVGDKSTSVNVPAGSGKPAMKVMGSTPALAGVENRLYVFNVGVDQKDG